MELILRQTARRALTETGMALNPKTPYMPGRIIANLSDVLRANTFLWTEANLRIGERLTRKTPTGMVLSRITVLSALAADLFTGYLTLQTRARWLPWLAGPQDWELQHERSANRLLDTAASLGGALIKACQFASTRPDLLPPIYIERLSQLQDHVPPQDWSGIEAAITKELGKPISEVFSKVEQKPLAAASLSQVHRAWLKDGRPVALKVLYPEVKELVAADLEMLGRIADLLTLVAPNVNLKSIVQFLKETLPLELDLRREASAMEELRLALANRPDVVIPKSLPEFSTERLLVMDYLEGIKITDREALEAAGINPGEVVRLLNEVYAEQVFRHNFLHADPHPGNLLVQPGPKLVILDHGLTVRLKPSLAQAMGEMVKSLMEGRLDEVANALRSAGLTVAEGVDLPTLLRLVGVILGGAGSRNILEVGSQIGTSIGEIPVDLLLVGRALGMLNGIAIQLDPKQDTLSTVARYVKEPEKVLVGL